MSIWLQEDERGGAGGGREGKLFLPVFANTRKSHVRYSQNTMMGLRLLGQEKKLFSLSAPPPTRTLMQETWTISLFLKNEGPPKKHQCSYSTFFGLVT